jgi:DNA-binding GntR family transcriptional regulator
VTADGFERPKTAQEAVLAELRKKLLARELKPGDPIRQDALATELGVSRVPVREALKILEGEGQVKYQPHYGYSVTWLEMADLEEIYRIREILEAEAVAHAIWKLSPADYDRMESDMIEMEAREKSRDLAALTSANRRFHFTLYEAASLPRLQHFIRVLWDASDPYRSLYYMDDSVLQSVFAEHRAIFQAACDRDIDTLIDLLAQHRRGAVEGLRTILDDGGSSKPM